MAGCGKSSSGGEIPVIAEVPELTEEELRLYLSEDGYIDPAAYGAAGDGVTDDTEALQTAIESGYNVRLQDTTYLIPADKALAVRNRSDFHMEGGTIHKEASPSNHQLFVLTDCTDCSFSDMHVYSEFTCKDVLIPKDHMRPSDTKSSNVLAFSGTGNTRILFKDNSFEYMSADYWFNATEDAFWKEITVDGWTSSTTLMPMFTQCVQGLVVRNAKVSLHPGSGDGDHCMYVCYRTSDVTVEDCDFTGNDSEVLRGAAVVLTFHGGNDKKGTQPVNITIRNSTLHARSGRALYCDTGTDIHVSDTEILQEDRTDVKPPVFGYGLYSFDSCRIQASNTAFEGMAELSLSDCRITGASADALITGVDSVTASGSEFTAQGGAVLYMSETSHPVHIYENCTFEKKGEVLPYSFSDRSEDGSITLKNCTVQAGGQWFSYDGPDKTVSSYSLENTELSDCLGMTMGGTAS